MIKRLTDDEGFKKTLYAFFDARDNLVNSLEFLRDDEANQNWDIDTCNYVEDLLVTLDNLDMDEFQGELTRVEDDE